LVKVDLLTLICFIHHVSDLVYSAHWLQVMVSVYIMDASNKLMRQLLLISKASDKLLKLPTWSTASCSCVSRSAMPTLFAVDFRKAVKYRDEAQQPRFRQPIRTLFGTTMFGDIFSFLSHFPLQAIPDQSITIWISNKAI
jgi:hypothetical protein